MTRTPKALGPKRRWPALAASGISEATKRFTRLPSGCISTEGPKPSAPACLSHTVHCGRPDAFSRAMPATAPAHLRDPGRSVPRTGTSAQRIEIRRTRSVGCFWLSIAAATHPAVTTWYRVARDVGNRAGSSGPARLRWYFGLLARGIDISKTEGIFSAISARRWIRAEGSVTGTTVPEVSSTEVAFAAIGVGSASL